MTRSHSLRTIVRSREVRNSSLDIRERNTISHLPSTRLRSTENPQSTPHSSEATVLTEPARATLLLSKSKHGKSSTDGYLCSTTSISRTSSIKTNKAIFIKQIKIGPGLWRNIENELRGAHGMLVRALVPDPVQTQEWRHFRKNRIRILGCKRSRSKSVRKSMVLNSGSRAGGPQILAPMAR